MPAGKPTKLTNQVAKTICESRSNLDYRIISLAKQQVLVTMSIITGCDGEMKGKTRNMSNLSIL